MTARHSLTFLSCFLSFSCAIVVTAPSKGQEPAKIGPTMDRLDRGFIAQQTDQGIYLGWRIMQTDPEDIAFNIYRSVENGKKQKLNEVALSSTSDFLDMSDAPVGTEYTIRPIIGGVEKEPCGTVRVGSSKSSPSCISIKLNGDHTFQKAGIADLNGDGKLDFVIKQPNQNIDPYEKYWKPSPDTYKLEAYLQDGTFLWRHDLGWSIECGIWYSPYVVYDLDGDGKAEVAVKTGEGDPRDQDGRVQTGSEWLTLLDGMTGKPITKLAWPERELFADSSRPYNYASRNQLCVAYLDGKTPSLIVVRGTYNVIIAVAYRLNNGSLEETWRWDNRKEPRSYWGQGAHWTQAADVDGDGRQEIILGSAVIDDNGKSLWTTGLGHPDHCYVGDIDPHAPDSRSTMAWRLDRRNKTACAWWTRQPVKSCGGTKAPLVTFTATECAAISMPASKVQNVTVPTPIPRRNSPGGDFAMPRERSLAKRNCTGSVRVVCIGMPIRNANCCIAVRSRTTAANRIPRTSKAASSPLSISWETGAKKL